MNNYQYEIIESNMHSPSNIFISKRSSNYTFNSIKKSNLYIIKKLLLQKIWKEYQKIYQLYKKNFLEIFMIIQEYSILKININFI